MITLKKGDKAPEFTAIDNKGNIINLKDFKGTKLVLYFYPKDNTPGCSAEACNLRDNYHGFLAKGFKILGVSADNEKAHNRFVEKYNLPFPLIPDTEKVIIKAYGVWGIKKYMGKESEGIIRTTFIISEKGIIEDIITKVDTKNHSNQIFK